MARRFYQLRLASGSLSVLRAHSAIEGELQAHATPLSDQGIRSAQPVSPCTGAVGLARKSKVVGQVNFNIPSDTVGASDSSAALGEDMSCSGTRQSSSRDVAFEIAETAAVAFVGKPASKTLRCTHTSRWTRSVMASPT